MIGPIRLFSPHIVITLFCRTSQNATAVMTIERDEKLLIRQSIIYTQQTVYYSEPVESHRWKCDFYDKNGVKHPQNRGANAHRAQWPTASPSPYGATASLSGNTIYISIRLAQCSVFCTRRTIAYIWDCILFLHPKQHNNMVSGTIQRLRVFLLSYNHSF